MRDWLDGPRFVDWLEDVLPDRVAAGRSSNGYKDADPTVAVFGRALARWRNGQAVSIYTADFYLTCFGLHIELIPDDLFRDSPGRRHPLPRPDRKELIAA